MISSLKNITKLNTINVIKQYLLVQLYAYKAFDVNIVEKVTDGVVNCYYYGEPRVPILKVVKYIIFTKALGLFSQTNKDKITVYAVNHDKTNLLPGYDVEAALKAANQKNVDYMIEYLDLLKLINFLRYHDV